MLDRKTIDFFRVQAQQIANTPEEVWQAMLRLIKQYLQQQQEQHQGHHA